MGGDKAGEGWVKKKKKNQAYQRYVPDSISSYICSPAPDFLPTLSTNLVSAGTNFVTAGRA